MYNYSIKLDCGDNSCHFAKDKTGIRTNGGCRCFSNAGFNRSLVSASTQMLPELLKLRKIVEQINSGQLPDGTIVPLAIVEFIERFNEL